MQRRIMQMGYIKYVCVSRWKSDNSLCDMQTRTRFLHVRARTNNRLSCSVHGDNDGAKPAKNQVRC